jgi:hypothetical protein
MEMATRSLILMDRPPPCLVDQKDLLTMRIIGLHYGAVYDEIKYTFATTQLSFLDFLIFATTK